MSKKEIFDLISHKNICFPFHTTESVSKADLDCLRYFQLERSQTQQPNIEGLLMKTRNSSALNPSGERLHASYNENLFVIAGTENVLVHSARPL